MRGRAIGGRREGGVWEFGFQSFPRPVREGPPPPTLSLREEKELSESSLPHAIANETVRGGGAPEDPGERVRRRTGPGTQPPSPRPRPHRRSPEQMLKTVSRLAPPGPQGLKGGGAMGAGGGGREGAIGSGGGLQGSPGCPYYL